MRTLYLLVDLFTILIPVIFSFHPKIKFYRTWGAFFKAAGLAAIIFLLWDMYFTSRGVWSFNKMYITGVYVFNLPIEEILFFICIPFSCVFTYYCLDAFYDLSWKPKIERAFLTVLCLYLLITGLVTWNKLYTSFSMISTALLCIYLYYIARVDWLGRSLTVYLVLLIPFLVVNGILTGTGLQAPVVIYNNAENLRIRILTIPIEDIFYGLELYLLNLYFYKEFLKKPPHEFTGRQNILF